MDKRTRSEFRQFSLGILILAVLFFLFFDRSKHMEALASANPFIVDPFDAVGSFGVLLALFVALLTTLRAFRPYTGMEIPAGGLDLILRGASIVILSIGVTLAADAIAVMRQPAETLRSPAGWVLIALMLLLAIANGGAARWFQVRLKDVARPPAAAPWRRAVLLCAACAAVLAAYPPAWDKGTAGGIVAALLGMAILFAAVWALAAALIPSPVLGGEDALDDLGAIYGWIKSRLGVVAGLLDSLEGFGRWRAVRSILNWVNPRRHPWSITLIGGVALGLALASAEALGEGVPGRASRFVLVGSVFVVIGTAGVIIGYGLLGRFLGIFYREPPAAES